MSKKDMLGPLLRALVGLPIEHHGIVMDVVNQLLGDNGVVVKTAVAKALREAKVVPEFTVLPDGTIAFSVLVNRARTPQATLDATGRKQYVTKSVVDAMPKGKGKKVEVVFFKSDEASRYGFITNDDLEKEFELRDLKPADPFVVMAVNEAYPAFADERPYGTYWKDANGHCYCTALYSLSDVRCVGVGEGGSIWRNVSWFAGVRKKKVRVVHSFWSLCFST